MRSTICPGSSDPFYLVSYNIKWVTTSWTHSNIKVSAALHLFGLNVVDNDLIVVAATVDAREAVVQAQAEYIGPSSAGSCFYEPQCPFVLLSCMSICPHPNVCYLSPSVCMSFCPHQSVCLSVPIRLYVYLSPSVCMSICPHPSVCLMSARPQSLKCWPLTIKNICTEKYYRYVVFLS